MQDISTDDLQIVLQTLQAQREAEVTLLKWLLTAAGVGVAGAFAALWRAYSGLVARLEEITEAVGGEPREKRPRGGRRASER